MKQIVLNYLGIFIIPFLAGTLVRFLFRKYSKAWLITVITALLALVQYSMISIFPNDCEVHAFRTIQVICLFLGSLLLGFITRVMSRKK